MGQYEQDILFEFQVEGGYCCNPNDPGGATNMGITTATLAAHRNVPVFQITPEIVKALSQAEASDIYRKYWTEAHADVVNTMAPKTAIVHFDWAINGGPGARCVAYLQAAINSASGETLKIDGQWGPATVAAVNRLDADIDPVVAYLYLTLRKCHYVIRANEDQAGHAEAVLVRHGLGTFIPHPNASQHEFLVGWLARLYKLATQFNIPISRPTT